MWDKCIKIRKAKIIPLLKKKISLNIHLCIQFMDVYRWCHLCVVLITAFSAPNQTCLLKWHQTSPILSIFLHLHNWTNVVGLGWVLIFL